MRDEHRAVPPRAVALVTSLPPGEIYAEVRAAYGGVTGRIQTLTSRGALRFTLYDRLHDKAVSCYLRPGQEEIMRDAWDQTATVEGWVSRDPITGRPTAVRRITAVRVIDREGDPDGYRRARGALKRDRNQPRAEVRDGQGDGFYVYWETSSAHGSRGGDLGREQAERLAERIRNGEIRP